MTLIRLLERMGTDWSGLLNTPGWLIGQYLIVLAAEDERRNRLRNAQDSASKGQGDAMPWVPDEELQRELDGQRS